jgi:hypothetical protein
VRLVGAVGEVGVVGMHDNKDISNLKRGCMEAK